MKLACAATTTTTIGLSFKNTSLTLLRRHAQPHQPPLLPSSATTSDFLTERRSRFTGDGDGVYRWSPVATKNVRQSYKFRRSAVYFAGGSEGGALIQDAGATVVVMAGAYALVLAFDFLTQRDFIGQNLSRKLVHILSGLLFMACWPIFSTSTEARYFASLVPLANCLRLVTHGLSLATDEGLVKSVTREGKPEELLRGPLYYVLVLILCVLVFWRESPIGVVSLAMMCGGDGIADIMGRRFGSMKIPYNKSKSWAGSISMFMFGFLISMGLVFRTFACQQRTAHSAHMGRRLTLIYVMLYYFSALGYFQMDWVSTVEKVALVSFVATLIESLSTAGGVDDNLSVPLASMVTAFLCFGY